MEAIGAPTTSSSLSRERVPASASPDEVLSRQLQADRAGPECPQRKLLQQNEHLLAVLAGAGRRGCRVSI